jgi:WD40 repeat protein
MGGFAEFGINSLNFHPTQDGILAVASDLSSIRIDDVNTNAVLYQLEGFTGSVFRLDWKPDGSALLGGYDTGQILIWDYSSAQLLAVLQAHPGAIQGLKWNNLGTKFASSSVSDGMIRIWDAASLPSTTGLPAATPFPTATPKP